MQLKKNGRDVRFTEQERYTDDAPSAESLEALDDLARPRPQYQPARAVTPVEVATSSPKPDRPESVIDANSSFDGRFDTAEDLRIEGAISGEIVCRGQLTVERDATARARIQARDLLVRGRVEGDVVCSGKLVIASSAVMTGTFKAATLVVEEGAALSGAVETPPASQEDSRRPAIVTRDAPSPSNHAIPPAPEEFVKRNSRREIPSFAVVSSEASDEQLHRDRN
jgi:cytoskeletal protein CcmA (bactofilin family)